MPFGSGHMSHILIGERTEGPVFLAPDARRLDRHAIYIVAAYVAGAAR